MGVTVRTVNPAVARPQPHRPARILYPRRCARLHRRTPRYPPPSSRRATLVPPPPTPPTPPQLVGAPSRVASSSPNAECPPSGQPPPLCHSLFPPAGPHATPAPIGANKLLPPPPPSFHARRRRYPSSLHTLSQSLGRVPTAMTGRPESKQREGVSRKAGWGRRVRGWLQPAAPRYTLRVAGGWRLAGHEQTGSSSSTPRQDAAVRVSRCCNRVRIKASARTRIGRTMERGRAGRFVSFASRRTPRRLDSRNFFVSETRVRDIQGHLPEGVRPSLFPSCTPALASYLARARSYICADTQLRGGARRLSSHPPCSPAANAVAQVTPPPSARAARPPARPLPFPSPHSPPTARPVPRASWTQWCAGS